jgi:hypothetical protein
MFREKSSELDSISFKKLELQGDRTNGPTSLRFVDFFRTIYDLIYAHISVLDAVNPDGQ